MRNNKLNKALQKLEIGEVAISIYSLLLDSPEVSITELCTRLGQYRAKVYEGLEELKAIGLIWKFLYALRRGVH